MNCIANSSGKQYKVALSERWLQKNCVANREWRFARVTCISIHIIPEVTLQIKWYLRERVH